MYIDSAIVRSSKCNLSKYHNALYIHLDAAEPNTHINGVTLHNVADLFLYITKRYQRHRLCITPIFLKKNNISQRFLLNCINMIVRFRRYGRNEELHYQMFATLKKKQNAVRWAILGID